MQESKNLEELAALAQDNKKPGHGERLRRALLMIALPATAALCTACYAAMPMPHNAEPPLAAATTYEELEYPNGVDCNEDGVPDVSRPEECPQAKLEL
jgi:hypothetical protein